MKSPIRTKFLVPSNKSSCAFSVIKEPTPLTSSTPPRVLKCLWNIGNCLLIIPARKESGPLQIIHRIACGLNSTIAFSLITIAMFSISRRYVGHLTDDPVGIFICAELISFLVFIVMVYMGSCSLGSKLADLLNAEFPQTRRDFWGWALATMLHAAIRLAEFIEILFFSPPNQELFQKFRRRFEANMFFFLSPETRNQLWNPYLNFFCTLSYISTKLVRIFGTFLVFGGIILHGSVVRKFCKSVQINVALFKFRFHYVTMQRQVDQLNNLFGPFLLGLTFHIFPMYMIWSTDLVDDSHSKDGKIREMVVYFNDFVLHSTFFGMAAYNYQKVVRTVEDTVLLHREEWNLDAGEFTSFLHRARHSELGMSGVGLFTITHKCISNVLSLMLTYTIVLIQFKSSRGGPEKAT